MALVHPAVLRCCVFEQRLSGVYFRVCFDKLPRQTWADRHSFSCRHWPQQRNAQKSRRPTSPSWPHSLDSRGGSHSSVDSPQLDPPLEPVQNCDERNAGQYRLSAASSFYLDREVWTTRLKSPLL